MWSIYLSTAIQSRKLSTRYPIFTWFSCGLYVVNQPFLCVSAHISNIFLPNNTLTIGCFGVTQKKSYPKQKLDF